METGGANVAPRARPLQRGTGGATRAEAVAVSGPETDVRTKRRLKSPVREVYIGFQTVACAATEREHCGTQQPLRGTTTSAERLTLPSSIVLDSNWRANPRPAPDLSPRRFKRYALANSRRLRRGRVCSKHLRVLFVCRQRGFATEPVPQEAVVPLPDGGR